MNKFGRLAAELENHARNVIALTDTERGERGGKRPRELPIDLLHKWTEHRRHERVRQGSDQLPD
jgi:hypothetical protein